MNWINQPVEMSGENQHSISALNPHTNCQERWWTIDHLCLCYSHRTWVPCGHCADHELLCISKFFLQTWNLVSDRWNLVLQKGNDPKHSSKSTTELLKCLLDQSKSRLQPDSKAVLCCLQTSMNERRVGQNLPQPSERLTTFLLITALINSRIWSNIKRVLLVIIFPWLSYSHCL